MKLRRPTKSIVQRQERSRVPGTKVPGNERSRERMFQGTNSLGNEYSWYHILDCMGIVPEVSHVKKCDLTGEKYDWLATWSRLGTAKWLTATCREYNWRRRLCISFVVCYCVSYAVHDIIISGPTAESALAVATHQSHKYPVWLTLTWQNTTGGGDLVTAAPATSPSPDHTGLNTGICIRWYLVPLITEISHLALLMEQTFLIT